MFFASVGRCWRGWKRVSKARRSGLLQWQDAANRAAVVHTLPELCKIHAVFSAIACVATPSSDAVTKEAGSHQDRSEGVARKGDKHGFGSSV